MLDDRDKELDEWFESLSAERMAVLERRIAKVMDESDDEEVQVARGNEILQNMYLEDLFKGLIEDGVIQTAGVDDQGEVMYALAE